MMRAVLLGRVSRGERTQDARSQVSALRAWARRQRVQVAAELRLTCSAWDAREAAKVRAAVLEALERTRAGALAIWAWDRYSRGGIEAAFREIAHLEGHLGVKLISLQEPFLSTGTMLPEQREMMLAQTAWHSKWESQRRSERLLLKVEQKRRDAAKLGKLARWGRGRLPSEAQRKRAGALRRAGKTYREIARSLSLPLGTTHRLLSRA